MLSVIIPNVVMLNVIITNVVMLSVIIPTVVMLNVSASKEEVDLINFAFLQHTKKLFAEEPL
jgi:hypothetical protein